jgi:hypothetical protein
MEPLHNADPWSELKSPDEGNCTVQYIDNIGQAKFFWTLHPGNLIGFSIEYTEELITSPDWPEWRELKSFCEHKNDLFFVHLILNNRENCDIFFHLSQDLMNAARLSESINGLINLVHKRLLRWKSLFTGDRVRLPGLNEIIGLIGELLFLKEWVLNTYDYQKSLEIWQGPLQKSQDFVFNKGSVEVKSMVKGKHETVHISSLEQLYSEEESSLVLCIYELIASDSHDSDQTVNLYDLVEDLIKSVELEDIYLAESWRQHLARAGYVPTEALKHPVFQIGRNRSYEVSDTFPCIKEPLPEAVERVRYELRVSLLDSHIICWESLKEITVP